MKRVVNLRSMLFVFLGMLLGVVFTFFIVPRNYGLIIFIAILLLSLIAFSTISFLKNNEKYIFISKFLICIFIGIAVGIFSSIISYFSFNNNNFASENDRFVSGRVEACSYKNSCYYVILEDVSILVPEENKNYQIHQKIAVYLYSESEIENLGVGSSFSYYGLIYNNFLKEDGKFNSYYYKNNIKYHSTTNLNNIVVSSGNLKFDEKLKQKVKNILYENMDFDSATLSYASIFGDKTMMDTNIYSFFSSSGTAHILAVSGLHVGFLVGAIYFILKKFKLKPIHIFIILLFILSFYAYLCNFSPSVVRASIMILVFYFGRAIGKRNDSLNSLGFAGALILTFKPFYAFDLGFQLSFASCFGIFLIFPTFLRLFEKIKFRNRLSEAFSLTLSAQIGTFPIILHNFENLSLFSILANIVIVPFFSFVFVFLILAVTLNLILDLGFLLIIPNIMFHFIISLAKFFGTFNAGLYSVEGFSIFGNLLFYFLVFCFSRYLILKNKSKVVLISILTFVFVISSIYNQIPTYFSQNSLINIANCNATIITNSDNLKILVNVGEDDDDYTEIKNALKLNRIKSINYLLLTDYSQDLQENVIKFVKNYNIKRIYLNPSCDDESQNYLAKNLKNCEIYKTQDDYCTVFNITFKIVDEIKGIYFNILDNFSSTTLLVCDKITIGVINFISHNDINFQFIKTNYLSLNNYVRLLKQNANQKIICTNAELVTNDVFESKNTMFSLGGNYEL